MLDLYFGIIFEILFQISMYFIHYFLGCGGFCQFVFLLAVVFKTTQAFLIASISFRRSA